MIIYYYGTDGYRLREAIRHITQKADHAVSFDLALEGHAQEFERKLKYPSLFEESSVVTVRNILSNADVAEITLAILERYHADDMSDTTIIAVQEGAGGRDSAAGKKLKTYLKNNAKESAIFEPLSGPAQAEWVRAFCNERNGTIEPTAHALLTHRTGPDSWAIANELEKLCAYSHVVSRESVATLVPERMQYDDFELSNAIYSNNKRLAISSLWRKFHEGTPEQLILGTFASAIRTLLTVKDLANQHMPSASIAHHAGIHPFVADRAIRGAAGYTQEQLSKAHQQLTQLDRLGKDGQADFTDELFAILIGL